MAKQFPPFLHVNGALVPFEEARVHVLSTSLKYAIGVFEGFRAYWNEEQKELFAFRLDDHFSRLVQSMRMSAISGPTDVGRMVEDMLELIRANELREDLHMRAQAFVDLVDGPLEASGPATLTLAAIPMGRYFSDREGLHVGVSSWRRIDETSMPPRIKAIGNYHNSRLASLEVKGHGFDAALLLTAAGKVAEGPGFNLFMVRKGRLVTPPTTEGILEGITRDSVIKLAAAHLGLTVEERPIDRTELYVADEAFFCGSAAEVSPILSVDRFTIGAGEPGEITRALRTAYLDAASGRGSHDFGWLRPVYVGAASLSATPRQA